MKNLNFKTITIDHLLHIALDILPYCESIEEFMSRAKFNPDIEKPIIEKILKTLYANYTLISRFSFDGMVHTKDIINPFKYIYKYLKSPEEKFSPENKRILFAFSGGKDSLFVKEWLDYCKIDYDTITWDEEWKNEVNENSKLVLPHLENYPYGKVPSLYLRKAHSSDKLWDVEKYGIIPIVFVQRLLLAKYAIENGYNVVLTADEFDTHILYKIFGVYGDYLYSLDFYQTQYFYNMLNELFEEEGIDLKFYTPISKVSQLMMIKYHLKKGNKFYSCWNKSKGWCNECEKCLKTVKALYVLGRDINEIEGLNVSLEDALNNLPTYSLGLGKVEIEGLKVEPIQDLTFNIDECGNKDFNNLECHKLANEKYPFITEALTSKEVWDYMITTLSPEYEAKLREFILKEVLDEGNSN